MKLNLEDHSIMNDEGVHVMSVRKRRGMKAQKSSRESSPEIVSESKGII